MFTLIPDAYAILVSRGVYRQVPIFERDGLVYAKHGGGFIKLRHHGGTSAVANIVWQEIGGIDYKVATSGNIRIDNDDRAEVLVAVNRALQEALNG